MRSNLSKAAFLIVLIAVSASVIGFAYTALKPYIDHPTHDLTDDIDWRYLNKGLDRIHSFRDTERWWTGAWCGEVPFWRPLTSYVLWTERLLWPKDLMLPRQIIMLILHLIFVGMAGYLAWKLTGRKWLALLSVWLFAGFRPFPVINVYGYNPAVHDLLRDPKNVTDPLNGIAMMLSLILLANGRWAASLVLAMISVGFKETGFMAWPMALLTILWVRKTPSSPFPHLACPDPSGRGEGEGLGGPDYHRPLPALAWAGGFAILAVVHYLTVGLGYRLGANAAWLGRAELYFGGPVGRLFVLNDPGAAIVSLFAFLTIIASRKLSLLPRFAAVMAALTAAVLLDARLQHTSWDTSLVRLFTYRLDLGMILICLFWLLMAWEVRHDWKTAGFALGMSLLGTLPSWTAAQTLEHTRYLASFFMEMAVAAALCKVGQALFGAGMRWRIVPSRGKGSSPQ